MIKCIVNTLIFFYSVITYQTKNCIFCFKKQIQSFQNKRFVKKVLKMLRNLLIFLLISIVSNLFKPSSGVKIYFVSTVTKIC